MQNPYPVPLSLVCSTHTLHGRKYVFNKVLLSSLLKEICERRLLASSCLCVRLFTRKLSALSGRIVEKILYCGSLLKALKIKTKRIITYTLHDGLCERTCIAEFFLGWQNVRVKYCRESQNKFQGTHVSFRKSRHLCSDVVLFLAPRRVITMDVPTEIMNFRNANDLLDFLYSSQKFIVRSAKIIFLIKIFIFLPSLQTLRLSCLGPPPHSPLCPSWHIIWRYLTGKLSQYSDSLQAGRSVDRIPADPGGRAI